MTAFYALLQTFLKLAWPSLLAVAGGSLTALLLPDHYAKPLAIDTLRNQHAALLAGLLVICGPIGVAGLLQWAGRIVWKYRHRFATLGRSLWFLCWAWRGLTPAQRALIAFCVETHERTFWYRTTDPTVQRLIDRGLVEATEVRAEGVRLFEIPWEIEHAMRPFRHRIRRELNKPEHEETRQKVFDVLRVAKQKSRRLI